MPQCTYYSEKNVFTLYIGSQFTFLWNEYVRYTSDLTEAGDQKPPWHGKWDEMVPMSRMLPCRRAAALGRAAERRNSDCATDLLLLHDPHW